MTALSDFGLKTDPFPLWVSTDAETVHHWAGRDKEKRLLLDIVESPRLSDIGTTEFAVLYGNYGAGKSHAMKYLSTYINDVEKQKMKGYAIYLSSIKVSEKITFLNVYKVIINKLTMEFFQNVSTVLRQRLNEAMVKLVQQQPPAEATQFMQQAHPLKTAIDRWVPASTRPFVELLTKEGAQLHDAIRYLRGENISFPEMGLNTPINTDFAAVSNLAGLFRALTLQLDDVPGVYECIYLLVDEQEALVDMKATETVQITLSFRELLNQLPQCFCMIWSFSADAALIEAVLPQAILQRMTRKYVELPNLGPEEAKSFLATHLKSLRIDGFDPPSPYYPFSEAAIDCALEKISEMTPRNIFKSLRTVLERSIKRHDLKPPAEISGELAEEILDAAAAI